MLRNVFFPGCHIAIKGNSIHGDVSCKCECVCAHVCMYCICICILLGFYGGQFQTVIAIVAYIMPVILKIEAVIGTALYLWGQ